MKQSNFSKLVNIVEMLRGPGGCPWDRKQKLKDIKNYILEEVYELCDALDSNNPQLVKEEIGDLFLLLIVFSSFFKDKKLFTVEDTLKTITEKLISRHPHVFTSRKLKSAEAVLSRWIRSKSKKKKRKNVNQRIPKRSPALLGAHLFLREFKVLHKVKLADLKKDFSDSVAFFERSKNSKYLVDVIFHAACIISYRNNNPELMLKKKVRRKASAVKY